MLRSIPAALTGRGRSWKFDRLPPVMEFDRP
jgi:hypothetical protein